MNNTIVFSKKIILIFIFLYSFINFFNRGILQAIRGRKSDLSSYYTASLVLKNNMNPYDTDIMLETGIKNNSHTTIAGIPRVHKYVYPPFVSQMLTFFTYISFDKVKILWTVLINPIFIFLILLFSYKYTFSISKTIFLTFLFLTFNPLYETIAFGQINIILLAFILLAFYFYESDNHVLCALFLALGIFTKILPVVLFLFFMFFKEYKVILWTVIFSVLLLLFQILLNGFEITFIYFFDILPTFSKGAGPSVANNSFYSFLQYSFNNNLFISIIFYTVILFFLYHTVKIKSKPAFFVLNIILLHLLPKTVWEHHYLVLYIIPLIMVRYNFFNSKKIFISFLIFWAVFSIKYNYYTPFFYDYFVFLRYIKVFIFIIFSCIFTEQVKNGILNKGIADRVHLAV